MHETRTNIGTRSAFEHFGSIALRHPPMASAQPLGPDEIFNHFQTGLDDVFGGSAPSAEHCMAGDSRTPFEPETSPNILTAKSVRLRSLPHMVTAISDTFTRDASRKGQVPYSGRVWLSLNSVA